MRLIKMSRKPEIIADAAYYILKRSSKVCTGNTFIDEDVLAEEGIKDLWQNIQWFPEPNLYQDLFV